MMGFLAGVLSKLITRKKKTNKDHYVFYKIVHFHQENENFLLQCINTKATFQSTLTEIVFDLDILYGLHPVQSCYIGIEYAKHLRKHPLNADQPAVKGIFHHYSVHRYGNYRCTAQNRAGHLSFVNLSNNEVKIMDPKDMITSETLIEEFDAAQAFYIGLSAGLKINNDSNKKKGQLKKRSHLSLIK